MMGDFRQERGSETVAWKRDGHTEGGSHRGRRKDGPKNRQNHEVRQTNEPLDWDSLGLRRVGSSNGYNTRQIHHPGDPVSGRNNMPQENHGRQEYVPKGPKGESQKGYNTGRTPAYPHMEQKRYTSEHSISGSQNTSSVLSSPKAVSTPVEGSNIDSPNRGTTCVDGWGDSEQAISQSTPTLVSNTKPIIYSSIDEEKQVPSPMHDQADPNIANTSINKISNESLNSESHDMDSVPQTLSVSTTHSTTAARDNKSVWKPRLNRTLTREDELDRMVKALLNKLTVEKFDVIAEKLARVLEGVLNSPEEVMLIVNVVLEKAVTEPDWSEMYADLCQVLQWRSVSPEGDPSTARKTPFLMALLTKIEREYEAMPKVLVPNVPCGSPDPGSEDEDQMESHRQNRVKKRILGVVKLIGELFQRKLLGFKIVQDVVVDLVINSDEPDEHFIDCFLQLISTIGYYIDQNAKYRMVLDSWFGRLVELQKKNRYSKRLKCVIQDTLDMRKAEWRKKIHKERAKALSDLRDQLATEEVLGGSVHVAQYGNIVVVGERSNLNGSYAGYLTEQEELYTKKRTRRTAATPKK